MNDITPSQRAKLIELNTLNKRRDALARKYTNAVGYGALGIGLKEAIDYIIDLEDALKLSATH